jgi:hypothetical protein
MNAHEERVVIENNELQVKISALKAFFDTAIYASLSQIEKTLLSGQFCSMVQYGAFLQKRIDLFIE